MPQHSTLDFYAQPSGISDGGKFSAVLENLPDDVGSLVRTIQGLTIHEYMASAYGATIPDSRRGESHLRPSERLLEAIFEQSDQPLAAARPPEKRLVGVCRHFAVLLVSALRHKKIPARARVGYAAYLNPGYFENHWVCEYWNENESRWILVDAQIDDVWRKNLKPDFDSLDVPRDCFIVAGDAWAKCRDGRADAAKFGIFKGNLRGLWFIASDLVRDVAALNKAEMLAWDVWGAMPQPDESLAENRLAFFDSLAALSRQPDSSFAELRELYANDDRLRVPPKVFNALLNRVETI